MRLGQVGSMMIVVSGALSGAAGAVPTKDQPPSCEQGTTWHEEQDLARYTQADGDTPARVGWCMKADGTRHGLMRMWSASGWLKSESTWVDGVENGPAATFYADGKPQLQTTHEDGRPVGRYVHWHPNGLRARLMSYESGRPHGWARYWDERGQLTAEGAYVDGKKEGAWESWYGNGVFKDVARFEGGLLHGRQLVFAEGGVFYMGACWDRGEKVWDTRSEVEARTRKCRPY